MKIDEPQIVVPLLSVRGVSKHFGGVQALQKVDIDVQYGEVHELVGANGAGKSTLIRILAGVEQPDEGQILLNGAPVTIPNPQASTRMGFGFIHQELNLVPKFNAIQNMTLGLNKANRAGLIDWRQVRQEVDQVAERIKINFPLTVPVGDLSVAEQWLVSIGRALIWRASLIAMDEPTASLSETEANNLFRVIRELAQDRIGILYVSHRLDEILDLCDTVTVFKDGKKVAETTKAGNTKDSLVRAIVGGEIQAPATKPERKLELPVILDVKELSRGKAVKGVSLQLHKGEVLGLGGLVGAGRSELVRLIFGADKLEKGTMEFDGQRFKPKDPAEAVSKGIALVPEERRSEGLFLDKSVSFNINIPFLQPLKMVSGLPVLNMQKGRTQALEIIQQLGIKTSGTETPVMELSGGNQQKVVIGKWLARNPKIIILDEPSRGVDVGARNEIHQIIRKMAANGTSFIVISSEVEELPGLCDRVLVMVEGKISGELIGDEITKEAILHLSYAHSNGVEK